VLVKKVTLESAIIRMLDAECWMLDA